MFLLCSVKSAANASNAGRRAYPSAPGQKISAKDGAARPRSSVLFVPRCSHRRPAHANPGFNNAALERSALLPELKTSKPVFEPSNPHDARASRKIERALYPVIAPLCASRGPAGIPRHAELAGAPACSSHSRTAARACALRAWKDGQHYEAARVGGDDAGCNYLAMVDRETH